MPRPSQIDAKRRELLPIVAQAFAELGYRRTTTAELAARCGVQETILYRLFADKRRMFIAAIGFVYDNSIRVWQQLLGASDHGVGPARALLDYESTHHGELGLYRIVFAGLSETDDPEIRDALRQMYRHFARFAAEQIAAERGHDGRAPAADETLAAWALIGLGTVASIGNELDLLSPAQRARLFSQIGTRLIARRPTKRR